MKTKHTNPTRSGHWFSTGCKLTLALAASALLAGSTQAQVTIVADSKDAIPRWNDETPAAPYVTDRLTSPSVSLGREGSSAKFHNAVVFPFQLPTLGAGEVFGTATFQFNYSAKNGTLPNENGDLYGLTARIAPDVLPSPPGNANATTNRGDWYMGGANGFPADDTTPGVTKLQDNIIVNADPFGVITTDVTGSSNLVAYLNEQYDGGAGAGKYVFLRLTLDDPPASTQRYVIDTSENATAANRPQLTYTTTILAPTLVWLGDGSGNAWDTNGTAFNWTNITDGIGPVAFTNSDAVVFDDSSANTTINISGTVEPSSVTVSNSVNTYTFSGGTLGGGSLTKQGTNGLTLSSVTPSYTGDTAIEEGTLTVSSAANIALASLSGSGDLVKAGTGTLTVSVANNLSGSAAVQAGTLAINNDASGSASYQVDASTTLSVTEATPGATLSMSSLTFASGSTSLDIDDGTSGATAALISAPNLTNSGTVTVTYAATNFAPGSIILVDYEAGSSTLGSWTNAPLPAGVTGSLVTNVANSSIDLVISSVPTKIWDGNDVFDPDLWDNGFTANWDGSTTTYSDGDAVRFDDTGVTTAIWVNEFPVFPSLVWLTNSSKDYSFENGWITTPLLIKEGTGTASLRATGNSFTNIDLRAGTLSYEAGTTITESAAITGAGTLAVDVDPFASPTTLTLSGNMSGFDGPITVASDNTLTLGANNVLGTTNGTTTIASGATLELNGNKSVRGEQVIVSGIGATSGGAIYNTSATTAGTALDHVTLAGDTTFGGIGRWDIEAVDDTGTVNAKLDTTGGSFNLTKAGANTVALVSVDISANINNITVDGGLLGFERYTSSLGNPAGTLTLNSGQITFFQNVPPFLPSFTKNMTLNSGVLRKSGVGDVKFLGPITLGGAIEFQGNNGELEVTGVVDGFGDVNKTQGGTVSLLGANTYTGSTTVDDGTLTLSTASTGSFGHTVNDGATLGAWRASAGGTLTLSSLTLGDTGSGAVTLLFDLGSFDGHPTAALMDVSAGTLTTNAATYNVAVAADLNVLTPGTVALLKYAPGTFTNDVVYAPTTGIDGYATNNMAASRVELVVTSVSRALAWRGDVDMDWDINTTANWLDTTNSTVYKEVGAVGDIVTFGDDASNYTVNVTTTVTPGGDYVQVTSSNVYTFTGAGSIAGPVGVSVGENGAGLVLGGSHTYTGGTFMDGGTLTVSAESNLGDPSGELRWGGGTLQVNGSLTNTRPLALQNTTTGQNRISVATNQTVQLGGTIDSTANPDEEFWKSGPGTLVLTNVGNLNIMAIEGTTVLAGNAAITNGTSEHRVGGTNGIGTLTVKDSARLQSDAALLYVGNAGTDEGELNVQDNATLLLNSLYVGRAGNATGRVYQTGGTVTNFTGGAWRIGGNTASDSNAFGAYYLTGGQLYIQNPLQVGRHGTGELLVSGGASLTMADPVDHINVGEQATAVGTMTVDNGTVTTPGTVRVPFHAGSASLVISNGGTVTANLLRMGEADAGTGTVQVESGGTLTVGQISGLATNSIISFDDGTLKASGDSATFMQGLTSATIDAGGLTVDTDTNTITIAQNFGGTGDLTKEGEGTLVLNGTAHGYGDTVVNAGTLGGTGILPNNLTVTSGGTATVNPGASPGTLQVLGNVDLSGTALMEIQKVGLLTSQDKIISGGTITFGGTLVVTNIPGVAAYGPGDSFDLFDGTLAGTFASTNLPATDPVGNLITWNTSLLTLNGSITVATVAPPVTTNPPPALLTSVVGTNYELDWFSATNSYEGYTLQSQTNPLSVGLDTNWVDIPGTETMTSYTQAINLADPTVFFRLIYTNAP